MTDVAIRRALLSVSDKKGLSELGAALARWRCVATALVVLGQHHGGARQGEEHRHGDGGKGR